MKTRHGLSICWFNLILCACAPPWPPQDPPGEDEAFELHIDPPASPDAIARVVQLRLSPDAEPELPPAAELMLFQGKLGSSSLAQLAEHAPSATLQARRLAATVLSQDGALLLSPRAPLDAGSFYTLVSSEPLHAFELRVAEPVATPLLELVWPPEGQIAGNISAGNIAAVWCAPSTGPRTTTSAPLIEAPIEIALQPGDRAASLMPGVGQAAGRSCVRLQLHEPFPQQQELLAPPAIQRADGTVIALLDPQPLSAASEPAEPPAASCPATELPLGSGCALIQDDRMWITSRDARLWSLSDGAALDVVAPLAAGQRRLIHPLPPASQLTLHLATVALDGTRTDETVTITTAPAMPHPILSEVLANPTGPEPAQEWVELYNDGLLPAQLANYRLLDIGGEAALPSAVLPAGGYAVLVNESFDESADYDPMVPPDALLIRLPSLGKNGLNNQGEPLKLLDPQGAVVSRFPAQPKPLAGHSISRLDPKALADQPDAFAVTVPTPASPPR